MRPSDKVILKLGRFELPTTIFLDKYNRIFTSLPPYVDRVALLKTRVYYIGVADRITVSYSGWQQRYKDLSAEIDPYRSGVMDQALLRSWQFEINIDLPMHIIT